MRIGRPGALAERRAGLAEVVKSAWIDGEASVALLERSAQALVDGEFEATGDAEPSTAPLRVHPVHRANLAILQRKPRNQRARSA